MKNGYNSFGKIVKYFCFKHFDIAFIMYKVRMILKRMLPQQSDVGRLHNITLNRTKMEWRKKREKII